MVKSDRCRSRTCFTVLSGFVGRSRQGYAKRSAFEEYRAQSRGGLGLRNLSKGGLERNGRVVDARTVLDGDEVILITSGGKTIRMSVTSEQFRLMGRATAGVRARVQKAGDEESPHWHGRGVQPAPRRETRRMCVVKKRHENHHEKISCEKKSRRNHFSEMIRRCRNRHECCRREAQRRCSSSSTSVQLRG